MKSSLGNIVEGPMGLRMPESVARRIDEMSKGLPKDFTYRRVAKAVDDPRFGQLEDGSRTDVSTITTDDVDRDNEIILPGGIDRTDFLRNPTVFYVHDYTKPIGKALWVVPKGNGLDALTKYAKKPQGWEGPWLPDAVFSMMQEGIGCGKSIGLLPLSIRPVTSNDLRTRPDWRGADHIVDKSVMLEYSAAPLPVQSSALANAVSKGLIDKATASLLAYAMPPSKTQHPSPSMSKYSHIDFKATKEVAKAHKEGLERYAAGESKGHATPEMCAMARHMAEGGEASPDYVRKVCAYHDQNPHHLAAKPGTPAYCLAMLAGGHAGREMYKSILKSMDDADATPDTSVDQNGVQAAITKAEGAAENSLADGGAAVPEETKVSEETKSVDIPKCPLCKSAENVEDRPADPVKGKMYECAMCGKSFSQAESHEVFQSQRGVPEDALATKALTKAKKDEDDKAEGTVVVNHDTVARAASLIDHGHYTEDAWEAPNGGDRKPEDCLGKRQGEGVQPAEQCVAPVIKNGQVYVHAVADAESRMSGSAVGEAAAALMRKIQAHRQSSAKTKAVTRPALTAEQVNQAVEREIDSRQDAILQKAIEKAQDLAILAMGGV